MADLCVLVASANAEIGMYAGVDILRSGGPAIDAVEAVVRIVEDNPDDHTVGFGGFPNVAGEVELDASVMDGRTRRAGAVGALQGFRHPVSVARKVMDHLPHVLLVGAGAAAFAAEHGLEEREMLTAPARETWTKGLRRYTGGLPPSPPFASLVHDLVLDPEHVTSTVNVIARDAGGGLASAASTSGWAWKYPGRVGDTGIIGAGNYCDDRFGAATCTGWGELAIRGRVAAAIVAWLDRGLSLDDACSAVLTDLPDAGMGGLETPLHVLAMDSGGRHGAFSTTSASRYVYWDSDHSNAVVRNRIYVNVDKEKQ